MKKKHYIRLYQDIDCTYQISGDDFDYDSSADEICNSDPANGSMFCIVVPGLYDWHNRFVNATNFADTKTREDFNWALWHRDGLLLAKEIQRQLPRDFTLIYDHPFEDKSGLIDKVNMETDDVDSIISDLHIVPGTASNPVRKDNVACDIERNGDFLDVKLSIGRFSTTVRFDKGIVCMTFLRTWMEKIVEGDNNYGNIFVNTSGQTVELFLFPQFIGGHEEMGRFWVRKQGDILPEFSAYVNKREFVRTLYLSLMTKLGFYLFNPDDGAEDLSATDKYEKYYRPYNELKSDIIEWFITDELYFKKKMPLDEGAHCVTEPMVMYSDYGHAVVWNSSGACCNKEDECIYCDHQVVNINVPGLLDWTGEYDSKEIDDFEAFWNDGWILAKKLRRQLPPNVDLYYMSFDTSDPSKKMDYAWRYPKIIVPWTECDEEKEQFSKVYEKAEPYRLVFQGATEEEMKAEAISRMKTVIAYEPIIEDFSENNNVEVYEPPYGCCYSLEKEDHECLNEIQEKEKVLIWGVIREFPKLNPLVNVRDNYLFVGRNKLCWDDERAALANMTPEAFIVYCKNKSSYRKGEIGITISQGGTILIDELL